MNTNLIEKLDSLMKINCIKTLEILCSTLFSFLISIILKEFESQMYYLVQMIIQRFLYRIFKYCLLIKIFNSRFFKGLQCQLIK